jgi:hypothetical protein
MVERSERRIQDYRKVDFIGWFAARVLPDGTLQVEE